MGWWTRTLHNRPGGDLLLNDPDGWVIEQPELHWLGPDSLSALLALGRQGGGFASEELAATSLETSGGGFPAITRATSLIVDPLAGVPWEVIRGRDTLDTPRWISDPQLARPDSRLTDWQADGVSPLSAVSFWTQAILSALWYGDGFVWTPSRDLSGAPQPPLFIIHPLLVDVVTPAQTDTERPTPGYWLKTLDESAGKWVKLAQREVIHLRGMAPYWAGRGRGAITGHLRAWEEAGVQRNYSTGIFTAGIPAGYLKVTAPNLTEPQAEALRSKWEEKHGSLTKRGIAVLNATTDFVALQLDPQSAQLAEGRKAAILDVANAFGVEPFQLGLPSEGNTYANLEARSEHFVRSTLLPWARRIESALDAEFPLGTSLHVNLSGMARAESGVRVAYYTAGLAQGWLTIDEVRKAEGMPPLEGAPVVPLAPVRETPAREEESA